MRQLGRVAKIPTEIHEISRQTAIYYRVPVRIDGFPIAREVFREEGIG